MNASLPDTVGAVHEPPRSAVDARGAIRESPLRESWHDADDLRWAARHWATRIGVRLREVRVRSMTNKWASMSTAGRLTLNTDLLSLPRHLGEYVIVHELVHLLAPNHGKVFKSFMHAYLPDWEEREQALRRQAVNKPHDD